MRKLIILIFLLSSIFINAQNSTITWNEDIKLAWIDFLAKPDENSLGTAKTSYKINIIPENVQVDENDNIRDFKNLSVKATFYKNHSWSKAKIKKSNLLEHEQLHFDIAELYARKIRRKFKELQQKNEAKFSIYQQEYSKLWNECRKYQKLFDSKTEHGAIIKLNQIWIQKIHKELLTLKGF